MRRSRIHITAFLAAALFTALGVVTADLPAWNAAITAENPLSWYKFDEPAGTTCYDSGTDDLNGTYYNVTLAQEGLFGEGTAALFDPLAYSVVQFDTTTGIDGDWTAEYIVKKHVNATQALSDSAFTSIRLEGWNSGGEVGFVLYNVLDYRFTAILGESLHIPLDQWIHIVFRRNAEGTQVFINGVLAGTQEKTVEFPRTRIGRGLDTGWDHLNGLLDEAVIFNRALSDETIGRHARAALPNLIPDYFELYEDTAELDVYWSGDAALTLETGEVYDGEQAMKAVFPAGGNIVKDVGREVDYTIRTGQDLVFMFKGDPANLPGDVTLTVQEPNGITLDSVTYPNGTQVTEWSELKMLVSDTEDPNKIWTNVKSIKIDVAAASTMYFDNLEIVVPYYLPKKVVEWNFNEGTGKTAHDSTGNGIDGSMMGLNDENWIQGGRTGQVDDYAIAFDGGQNQTIKALGVDLSGLEVQDIFPGHSSWTINVWLKFPDNNRISMVGGFGDCDWTRNADEKDRYFNKWNETVQFNYGDNGFWYIRQQINTWEMWTATYNKWVRVLKLYRNGELISTRTVTLFDTDENAVKLGNVGDIAWTPDKGKVVPLVGQIDDFCIWDADLPWVDDDPETDDIATLYGSWVCYDRPDNDFNGDCLIDIDDLAYIISVWLESGRHPEEI